MNHKHECPGCRARFTVPEKALGRRVQCPHCREVSRVAAGPGVAAPQPEPGQS